MNDLGYGQVSNPNWSLMLVLMYEDDVWITEGDLARIRPDLLKPLPDTPANSTESSSSDPGRIGGVRPPSPPRHDTTAPVEPTPTRVQPPRQAKTKDPEFHYTK